MGPVSDAYAALLRDGALSAGDVQQQAACGVLDEVAAALETREKAGRSISGLFSRQAPVKGAYLFGDVGRGKTLLMDLFFSVAPVTAKRRVHFHEFMGEIHAAIAKFRAKAKAKNENTDPIAAAVKPIVKSIRLLCLDEFHVQDITNAMLLQRLFEKLYEGGVVVVATSNVPPDRLYENGLNRQLFLPFIALLKQHATLVTLNGPTDYRRLKFEGQAVYFFGSDARAQLDALWLRLTGGQPGTPEKLPLLGRTITVPRAAMGAARFDFAELCDKPLGAADYLKLAHTYDTLVIDSVPQFDRTRSNAAKRFILLIDTLYDRGVKLAASFAVPLDALGKDDQTRFEFARCVSRLIEMQSTDYLAAPHKGQAAA